MYFTGTPYEMNIFDNAIAMDSLIHLDSRGQKKQNKQERKRDKEKLTGDDDV